jgi:hypothetical protein
MIESYYLIVVNARYYFKMVRSDHYLKRVDDIPVPATKKPAS